MPAKANHTRVSISINAALLKQVNWRLEVHTRNRSQLVEDLLERWIYKDQTCRQREAEGRKGTS
jgi:metal-responsive CopG/Arc/MetJ family transcriptional regulator